MPDYVHKSNSSTPSIMRGTADNLIVTEKRDNPDDLHFPSEKFFLNSLVPKVDTAVMNIQTLFGKRRAISSSNNFKTFGCTYKIGGTIYYVFKKSEVLEFADDFTKFGSIYFIASYDSGRTWTSPALIYQATNTECTNVAGGVVNGVAYIWFQEVTHNPNTSAIRLIKTTNFQSFTNVGQFWQSGIGGAGAAPYGRTILLDNGRIFQSFYAPNLYVSMSGDNGDTWNLPQTIFTPTDVSMSEFCLTTIGDNKIIGIIRPEAAPYQPFQITSPDGGDTWSTPAQTNMQGGVVWIEYFSDGLLHVAVSRAQVGTLNSQGINFYKVDPADIFTNPTNYPDPAYDDAQHIDTGQMLGYQSAVEFSDRILWIFNDMAFTSGNYTNGWNVIYALDEFLSYAQLNNYQNRQNYQIRQTGMQQIVAAEFPFIVTDFADISSFLIMTNEPDKIFIRMLLAVKCSQDQATGSFRFHLNNTILAGGTTEDFGLTELIYQGTDVKWVDSGWIPLSYKTRFLNKITIQGKVSVESTVKVEPESMFLIGSAE